MQKEIPQKLMFCGNIYHFRVFYLESVSPEPNESSIIMKIGFKFAKIEYFQNLQKERIQHIYLPSKYGSLKKPATADPLGNVVSILTAGKLHRALPCLLESRGGGPVKA